MRRNKMSAKIIDGKKIAQHLREEMKHEIQQLNKRNIQPHLTVILIGNDPASHSYVSGKEKASKEVGISSSIIRLPKNTSEDELLNEIDSLNKDEDIDGILVQLPLPEHIDEQKVIEAIHPSKDVDGFHPTNIGRMMVKKQSFLPCTPYGIIKILQYENIKIEGKHVEIGRASSRERERT